jgi:lipoprotein NlpD
VKKGDTLYSIALDNGQDYKDVAAWNYLENPNLIKIGQQRCAWCRPTALRRSP